MAVSHEISPTGKYMFIKVGAKETVLQDEAVLMKLPMRLQHTKGQIPFQKEFVDHYVIASDGTCFNSAQRQQIVKHRMDRSLVITAKARMKLSSADILLKKFRTKLDRHETIRWDILREIFTACGAYRSDCTVALGKETHDAVKLTEWDKFIEVEYNGEIFGPYHTHGDTRLDNMLNATEELVDEAAAMAEAAAKDAMKATRKVTHLSANVMATIVGIDRQSHQKLAGKKQMRQMKADRYQSAGMKQLTFIELEKIYHELVRWLSQKGAKEKYVGTLEEVFPMHDLGELAFFQEKWARMWPVVCRRETGSWRCNPGFRLNVLAKANEGKGTQEGYYTGIEPTSQHKAPGWFGKHFSLKCMNPTEHEVSVHLIEDSWHAGAGAYSVPAVAEFGQTTPTSWYNAPERHWTYCYQPIDEIRDYFGDSVGLYFRWLGLYVSSLVTPAVAGLLVTLYNMTRRGDEVEQLVEESGVVGEEILPEYRSHGGAPNNLLSNAYSLYFAFWTVQFLSKWERTENEYQFLWGSADTQLSSDLIRPSYQGIIRMNLVTGKEKLVDRDPRKQNLMRLASWLLIICMILITVVVAIVCANLEKIAPPVRCCKVEPICIPNKYSLCARGRLNPHAPVCSNTPYKYLFVCRWK